MAWGYVGWAGRGRASSHVEAGPSPGDAVAAQSEVARSPSPATLSHTTARKYSEILVT